MRRPSSEDLPALGRPTRPTSASSLSRRSIQPSSPGRPRSAKRGAWRVGVAKCLLPRPPRPPRATTTRWPGTTRSTTCRPRQARPACRAGRGRRGPRPPRRGAARPRRGARGRAFQCALRLNVCRSRSEPSQSEHDVAAAAAVAAVGPAARDVGLAAEAQAAVSAGSALDEDARLVAEHALKGFAGGRAAAREPASAVGQVPPAHPLAGARRVARDRDLAVAVGVLRQAELDPRRVVRRRRLHELAGEVRRADEVEVLVVRARSSGRAAGPRASGGTGRSSPPRCPACRSRSPRSCGSRVFELPSTRDPVDQAEGDLERVAARRSGPSASRCGPRRAPRRPGASGCGRGGTRTGWRGAPATRLPLASKISWIPFVMSPTFSGRSDEVAGAGVGDAVGEAQVVVLLLVDEVQVRGDGRLQVGQEPPAPGPAAPARGRQRDRSRTAQASAVSAARRIRPMHQRRSFVRGSGDPTPSASSESKGRWLGSDECPMTPSSSSPAPPPASAPPPPARPPRPATASSWPPAPRTSCARWPTSSAAPSARSCVRCDVTEWEDNEAMVARRARRVRADRRRVRQRGLRRRARLARGDAGALALDGPDERARRGLHDARRAAGGQGGARAHPASPRRSRAAARWPARCTRARSTR